MKFGSIKSLKVGSVYRSTNRKFILIKSFDDKHFTYQIIYCDSRKGRSKDCKAGAIFTTKLSNLSNFFGPI